MLLSLTQSAQELVQNGIAPTIVGMVNLAAIAGVFVQSWRHRVESVREEGRLAKKLSALDTTLRAHMVNTPTHEMCLTRMKNVETAVQEGMRDLRNDVQGLTIERNGHVATHDHRIRDLERWQAIHQVADNDGDGHQ